MAKGDHAVRMMSRNTRLKQMSSSESSVAAVIAAKRRRMAGKRHINEGMRFSLPTPDGPFNDREGKTANEKPPVCEMVSPSRSAAEKNKKQECDGTVRAEQPFRARGGGGGGGEDGDSDYGCPSKFFISCLNAIQDSWKESSASSVETLLVCDWGIEFWKRYSSGSDIIDTSGSCASREQVAWLVSTASDVITRREKQGGVVASPFLLFLVPTQEKAVQVRLICKSLKALGIHTVSLHPGAPLNHQVQGLKICEPEFIVSTPERLVELVSLRAIDISGVSFLVLDGLKTFLDLGLADKVSSLRENISGNCQVVIFSDCCHSAAFNSLAKNLLQGPVSRLCQNDAITSQSAFVSQHVHLYTIEEERITKMKQILTGTLNNEFTVPVKVLLISEADRKCEALTTSLEDEGYAISKESFSSFSITSGSRKVSSVMCTDQESLYEDEGLGIDEFEMVMFVNLPTSIEDYVYVLTRMARHSINGALHSFFCEVDALGTQPLINVLMQCGQVVPRVLQNL